MKQLNTRSLPVTAAFDVEPVEPMPPQDWQSRFNKLRAEHVKVLQELESLKYPVRTPVELELDMQAVHEFLDSMGPAEGAVTCANIYTVAFLQHDHDHLFVVKLCSALVARFRPHQVLIQSTYDLWTQHAE